MLSADENERMTRIVGRAPAGELMRRYWLPALLADELTEPDGTPVRVRLLGEDLVAFRDSDCKLGLIAARCPHRLASLALGRNEESGLRCIYHGWKFDIGGRCVDMPTEPEGYGFRDRVTVHSYPLREAGGLIWTYLGDPDDEPPFPAFDWTVLPPDQVAAVKFVEHANYLQAVEGAIDTAHSWFLHRGALRDWKQRSAISMDLSPRLEVEDTRYGFRYAAIRRPNDDPENFKYVKVTNYVFPTTVLIPRSLNPKVRPIVQLFVPMDDENTMHYSVFFSTDGTAVDKDAVYESVKWHPGVDIDANYCLDTHEGNFWKQDRAAMKDGTLYSGIAGFPRQDVACQESMGAIVDRTQERLGTSDIAIIRMRRRMLDNIERVMGGSPAIGTEGDIAYPLVRSEQRVIPIDEPWQKIGAFAGEYDEAITAQKV
jgi:phthalate 4,5-dioxygenase